MMIMEADPAAPTEPHMIRTGALMSLRLTCPPTTREKETKMNVNSPISRGPSLLDEAKER